MVSVTLNLKLTTGVQSSPKATQFSLPMSGPTLMKTVSGAPKVTVNEDGIRYVEPRANNRCAMFPKGPLNLASLERDADLLVDVTGETTPGFPVQVLTVSKEDLRREEAKWKRARAWKKRVGE